MAELTKTTNHQQTALGDVAARHLAIATRTVPQMVNITPRWYTRLLSWVPVESGVYRLNKVHDDNNIMVHHSARDERILPNTFANYTDAPREYNLAAVQTIVNVHTRVSDLYSRPHNQVSEQLRLAIETLKERQESELINNPDYGLLNSISPSQRIKTRNGAPTPDDLDQLITMVWKEPGYFLMHPLAIAAFGRECTRRGVPPPTVSLFGSPFITWRGIPLIPSDKIPMEKGKTRIILMRTGESRQGVVGLFQPGLQGEQSPGLSVRLMGINEKAIASYLVSIYCSQAVLVEDAIAVLDNVETGNYYEYKN